MARRTKKYTIGEVKKVFADSGCTLLSEEYINAKGKLNYICQCGSESSVSLTNFLNGQRCRSCRNKKIAESKTHSYDYVKQLFDEAGCKLLESEYKSSRTRMKFICSCGNLGTITFSSFSGGHRCKKCGSHRGAEKLKLNYEYVKNEFSKRGCKLLSKDYINNNTPLAYICSCGRQSSIRYADFRSGQRCMECGIEKRSGENHPYYNPNLTDDERVSRRDYSEYQLWRENVYKRDKYACRGCSSVGKRIVAHHLDGYHWCKERRTDLSNGVTLCEDCHTNFHTQYGRWGNTESQFEEWLQNKNNDEEKASGF